MKAGNHKRIGTFQRAWEIIKQDNTIPLEDREGILKLIQVLIEAGESADLQKNADQAASYTQEVLSKHGLMSLVKQQADELDALRRIGLNLTSSLDLQTVLNAVVVEAMKLIKNSRAVHIFLFYENKLEFGASLTDKGLHNKPVAFPRSNGLTYQVAKKAALIMIEDIKNHPLYQNNANNWSGSIIGIPLKFGNTIVGVMNLSRSIIGEFSRSELRLLELLADQAAAAISNASLHRRMTQQAYTDSITGLPNRHALDERLQEEVRYARRTNSQFSVVMMDLDGFKAVNDTYGHAVGDDILSSAFNYLAQNMRGADFLARYGGDELTLIMRNSGIEETRSVTDKIIELMADYLFPVNNSRDTVKLGITAGIAVYPAHAKNGSDLLRAADIALYHAKKHYRGKYVVASGVTGPLTEIKVKSSE